MILEQKRQADHESESLALRRLAQGYWAQARLARSTGVLVWKAGLWSLLQ